MLKWLFHVDIEHTQNDKEKIRIGFLAANRKYHIHIVRGIVRRKRKKRNFNRYPQKSNVKSKNINGKKPYARLTKRERNIERNENRTVEREPTT